MRISPCPLGSQPGGHARRGGCFLGVREDSAITRGTVLGVTRPYVAPSIWITGASVQQPRHATDCEREFAIRIRVLRLWGVPGAALPRPGPIPIP